MGQSEVLAAMTVHRTTAVQFAAAEEAFRKHTNATTQNDLQEASKNLTDAALKLVAAINAAIEEEKTGAS